MQSALFFFEITLTGYFNAIVDANSLAVVKHRLRALAKAWIVEVMQMGHVCKYDRYAVVMVSYIIQPLYSLALRCPHLGSIIKSQPLRQYLPISTACQVTVTQR